MSEFVIRFFVLNVELHANLYLLSLFLLARTIAPVTTRFASDSGSITFHPKDIS